MREAELRADQGVWKSRAAGVRTAGRRTHSETEKREETLNVRRCRGFAELQVARGDVPAL